MSRVRLLRDHLTCQQFKTQSDLDLTKDQYDKLATYMQACRSEDGRLAWFLTLPGKQLEERLDRPFGLPLAPAPSRKPQSDSSKRGYEEVAKDDPKAVKGKSPAAEGVEPKKKKVKVSDPSVMRYEPASPSEGVDKENEPAQALYLNAVQDQRLAQIWTVHSTVFRALVKEGYTKFWLYNKISICRSTTTADECRRLSCKHQHRIAFTVFALSAAYLKHGFDNHSSVRDPHQDYTWPQFRPRCCWVWACRGTFGQRAACQIGIKVGCCLPGTEVQQISPEGARVNVHSFWLMEEWFRRQFAKLDPAEQHKWQEAKTALSCDELPVGDDQMGLGDQGTQGGNPATSSNLVLNPLVAEQDTTVTTEPSQLVVSSTDTTVDPRRLRLQSKPAPVDTPVPPPADQSTTATARKKSKQSASRPTELATPSRSALPSKWKSSLSTSTGNPAPSGQTMGSAQEPAGLPPAYQHQGPQGPDANAQTADPSINPQMSADVTQNTSGGAPAPTDQPPEDDKFGILKFLKTEEEEDQPPEGDESDIGKLLKKEEGDGSDGSPLPEA